MSSSASNGQPAEGAEEDGTQAAFRGAVAGIVICSILFLILVALAAYNIHLYLARRKREKQYRRRLVLHKDHNGWRPTDGLYAPDATGGRGAYGGSGTVNPGFKGSMGSVRPASVGSAPRAEAEDIADDVDDYRSPPPPQRPWPSQYYRPPRPSGAVAPRTRRTNPHNGGVRVVPGVHAPVITPPGGPEVKHYPARLQVSPQQLQLQNKQGPWTSYPPPGGPQPYSRGPPTPPLSTIALLQAESERVRALDTSLTGVGALQLPDLGYSPRSGENRQGEQQQVNIPLHVY